MEVGFLIKLYRVNLVGYKCFPIDGLSFHTHIHTSTADCCGCLNKREYYANPRVLGIN